MRKLLTVLTDIIFPPNADTLLIRALSTETVGQLYDVIHKEDWEACAPFKDPRVRALVHEAKYGQSIRAQKYLAHLLMTYIGAHKQTQTALWIPIPLSPARMRARGYNQVHEILKQTSMSEPITVRTDILLRTRDTKPQVELGRTERLTNMNGAFSVRETTAIANQDIILVDDVVTTGATLRDAKSALLPYHPRSVALLALAH
jgi:ComF family protein